MVVNMFTEITNLKLLYSGKRTESSNFTLSYAQFTEMSHTRTLNTWLWLCKCIPINKVNGS